MYPNILHRNVEGPFDGLFLGELIAFGAVTILFLFYFNRGIAWALSTAANSYLWTFYRVTVKIQAIQFSPLAGRVFLKGVRYHGQNETICIHDGYITWRYWFRRVAEAEATAFKHTQKQKQHDRGSSDEYTADSPSHDLQSHQARPCRIEANLRGLEWFVYNRKPAYDSILSNLVAGSVGAAETAGNDTNTALSEKPPVSTSDESERPQANAGLHGHDTSRRSTSVGSLSATSQAAEASAVSADIPRFLELFPISVTCSKAAMVMGNQHTRSVLVAKSDGFRGRINAHKAGPLDSYRQSFDFEAKNASASFKRNFDFEENQLAAGERIRRERHGAGLEESKTSWLAAIRANLAEARRTLEDMRFFPKRSNASVASDNAKPRASTARKRATSANGQDHWVGLSRYLVEDGDDAELAQERWKSVEYARVQTIFDVPKLRLSFYWDVAGQITTLSDPSRQASAESLAYRVNGAPSPTYGLEVNVSGGTLNYGPWADRQRADIQSIFFPASFSTAKPAQSLPKGSYRLSTVFNISFIFDEEVLIRIHTREPSKDARWKSQLESMLRSTAMDVETPHGKTKKGAKAALNPEIRPAAWIELALSKDSSVVYNMDMLARESGYRNSLQVDARDLRVTTSVNHDIFLRTDQLQVKGDLSNPLQWNVLHHWQFDVAAPDLELFMLRDHAFLLTDLVSDWTSGPAGNFFEFVPFVYKLGLQLPNFKMYLNTNDANIINNATSLDDNAFVLLMGQSLSGSIEIPLKFFQPVRNKVSFDLDASNLAIDMVLPSWTTQRSFMLDAQVATLRSLRVNGAYDYCASTAPMLTDVVLLDISGSQLKLTLHGFLVRYLMNLKDNYFGDFLHFQTQEEFQQRLEPRSRPQDQDEAVLQEEKLVNDLDVLLRVDASDLEVVLPSQLYASDEHVAIDMSTLTLDLRFTNYYMDMEVDFAPLSVSQQSHQSDVVNSKIDNNKTQIFVDGVTIIGHRLFGLPRAEPTYVCNWDFAVGAIVGEVDISMLSSMSGAARSFAHGFKDLENALHRDPIVEHDVIFLRAVVQPVNLWLHVGDSAFLLGMGEVKFNLNDWAGDYYSECIRLSVPRLVLGCIDSNLAKRARAHGSFIVPTLAYFETSIEGDLLESKANFEEAKKLQQSHINMHDARTKRTPWLLRTGFDNYAIEENIPASKLRSPAMPFPPMPDPLKRNRATSIDTETDNSVAEMREEPRRYQFSRQSSQQGPASDTLRPDMRHFGLGLEIGEDHVATSIKRAERSDVLTSSGVAISFQPSAAPALSGKYQIPCFPFLGISFDTQDVPILPLDISTTNILSSAGENSGSSVDRHSKCVTAFINLKGIRGLLTPRAMTHIALLAAAMQPTATENILDVLQAEAISEEQTKKQTQKPRTLQLHLALPVAIIRFVDQAEQTSSSHQTVQRYDLSLEDLQLTFQDRSTLAANENAIYLKLDHLQLTATSTKVLDSTVAQIGLQVRQLSSWIVKTETVRGHLQLEDVQASSPDHNTTGLAQLVSETVRLATQLENLFATTSERYTTRVANLIYQVMSRSKDVPEASLFTTTSFVLRTTTSHPRNTDSWKMVCRLRWILQYLSLHNDENSNLLEERLALSAASRDLRSEVLSFYDKWRGWDLTSPANASLIKTAFGGDEDLANIPGSVLPMDFSVGLARFVTTIHPELATNKIVVEEFCTTISRRISANQNQHDTEKWKIHVNTNKARVAVDWNIVKVINGIMEDVQAPVPATRSEKTSAVRRSRSPLLPSLEAHIVVTVNEFFAHAEALNVEASCSIKRFALSVCVDSQDDCLQNVLAVMHSASIETELTTKKTSLLKTYMRMPTMHCSWHSEKIDTTVAQQLKIGGLCNAIKVNVEQDLLGIIGVADRVVSDEIKFLSRFRIKPRSSSSDAQQGTETSSQRLTNLPQIQIHLGLRLESYTFSSRLLSSLRYELRGETARSTSYYIPHPRPEFNIEFDLGDQSHSFGDGQAQEIARVPLPSLNGQLGGILGQNNTAVSLKIAVERVVLDASALHALFSTYSRSELLAFRQEVTKDLKLLKANYASLDLGTAEASDTHLDKSMMTDRTLSYRACISAAGLKVKARTGKDSPYSARLTFDLGHVHFQIEQKDTTETVKPLPEMSAKVQLVSIVLKRSTEGINYRCGDFSIGGKFVGTTRMNDEKVSVRSYEVTTTELDVNLYPETASTIVDIIGYLQQRFKSFNLSEEINTLTVRARRLRTKSRSMALRVADDDDDVAVTERSPITLFSSMYSLEMNHLQAVWHVATTYQSPLTQDVENLIFSLSKIKLATQKTNSGRLVLENLQLQMAPPTQPKRGRSRNSALLPEVVFNATYLSTGHDRRLAFQAVGKSLDLQLTSQSIISASTLGKSIGNATHDLRKVIADWNAAFVREEQSNKNILGNKRLSSVLIAADFAGAMVHIQGNESHPQARGFAQMLAHETQQVSQNVESTARGVDLQAPGIALKLEYSRPETEDPALNVETKVSASSNTLHPAVVPLFWEMSASLKEVVGNNKNENAASVPELSKTADGDVLANTDPAAILGRTRLNLGLRIAKQQFGLTCNPIARVDAKAQFESIYVTIGTVQAPDQERFFALTSSIVALQCSLQHVYSREPTGRFFIERIDLSLINSKHISKAHGISAILRISPMDLHLNAKQMQDFFLFQAVWFPAEISTQTPTSPLKETREAGFGVQRYQQVAATGAFPWNASITILKLNASVDLGQGLGKSAFTIENLWVSSRKSSDREQNLCLGFDKIGIDGSGRMSGSIQLHTFRLRTSIHWPENMNKTAYTPLIEASISFGGFTAKLAFDYQAVMFADISSLDFLMYNVRDPSHASGDRLVCFVNGDKVHAFCTTQSSAQVLALYQAMTRLIQEKRVAYEMSLRDVEKYMQRRSTASPTVLATLSVLKSPEETKKVGLVPRQLQTNVVVSLNAVKVGAYPRSFFDQQIFKVEALDARARFSVRSELHPESGASRLRSGLGMSLGQVRVALSNLTQRVERQAFEEMEISNVVKYSTGSRGGTVLKVPRLLAEMQTWQAPDSFHIDYLFHSAFEGKVEVGWNYSRISYIRGMWASHARSLAQRLGRPLPVSAVQISGGLPPGTSEQDAAITSGDESEMDNKGNKEVAMDATKANDNKEKGEKKDGKEEPEKITAVVNVPLSRYDYTPVEPPIIVTPQLRDMGEATPPLEWIGLQRERLPHLTHQVVIVPLLEVAKEVEDAYVRILGSS